MEALRINLNMDQELSGDLFWGADADFSYPFPAFGLDWAWNLEGDFSMPDDGGPVQGKAATGISASVPLALGDLQLTLTQAAKFNQQDDDVPYLDEAYFSTTAQIGWRLPVDLSFSRYPTVLRPRVELGANWLPGGLQDGELARGPALESGFGLSHGRIDWLGNFRKGLMATADVSATYYLSDASFARKVTLEASAFNEAGWWGSGMRAYAVWSPEKDSNGAGSVVRGVLNSRAATDAAVAINLDLPVRVLRFVPFEWFGKPWMKVFQFEQHWSPFVDAALGHYDGTWFNPEKGWYGAGLEVMTFPLAMRSFYVRISIGWSLSDVVALGALEGKSPRDGRSIYELFFGLGHHY
ncbi:MAG: hypothetical protein A2Y38_00170 [Spirochaetes bacterium GWB1_59_5]|nr:MAG: hypothetical protein A2Y38_00170 [Spirochaetes bacterium GWB1_59_5]